MPRPSIEEVGAPPVGYRVDQHKDSLTGFIGFETDRACRDEVKDRIRESKAALKSGVLDKRERRRTIELLKHLKLELAGKGGRLSAASRLAMREWRIRVSGWLWSLVDKLKSGEWVFFTLVLPSWWVRSGGLLDVDAKRLTERLRRALDQAGSSDASGWLYAMIHGEYDGATKGFPVHVHGLATKGMIKVLRNLRRQRQFRRNKSDGKRYPQVSVAKKLVIEQPRDVPQVITYASKSFWLQHDSLIEPDGARRRVGPKRRIRDRLHLTRCLLWLHANRVKDQVLLIHLSVVDGELVPGKRGAPKSK